MLATHRPEVDEGTPTEGMAAGGGAGGRDLLLVGTGIALGVGH